MKRRKIEEKLAAIESRLENAAVYIEAGVNVEGTSFLHFDDWQGKSGHPSWMKNFMVPTMRKHRARMEKSVETISAREHDKELTRRKRKRLHVK
jgi:hypothetical protein